MRLYMIRTLSNELAPHPESSSLEGDKDLCDFPHFGQSQLSQKNNLTSEVLFNGCKTCGIWPARLEQLLR